MIAIVLGIAAATVAAKAALSRREVAPARVRVLSSEGERRRRTAETRR